MAGLITLVELEERMEAREPNGEVWVNFSNSLENHGIYNDSMEFYSDSMGY